MRVRVEDVVTVEISPSVSGQSYHTTVKKEPRYRRGTTLGGGFKLLELCGACRMQAALGCRDLGRRPRPTPATPALCGSNPTSARARSIRLAPSLVLSRIFVRSKQDMKFNLEARGTGTEACILLRRKSLSD